MNGHLLKVLGLVLVVVSTMSMLMGLGWVLDHGLGYDPSGIVAGFVATLAAVTSAWVGTRYAQKQATKKKEPTDG